MMARFHYTATLILVAVGLTISGTGCNRLQTEYGHSQDALGRKSIAGFGVLRQLYRQAGWQDRTITRLSERLNNVDAIVWTPANTEAPTIEVTEWMEEWLARDHKTLVYVLRDFETIDQYWSKAARQAPPEQRLEYRRRSARARMDKLRELLELPRLSTNGWYTALPNAASVQPQALAGPWAIDIENEPLDWQLNFSLRSYDSSTDQVAVAAAAAAPAVFSLQSAGTTETAVAFEPLLKAADGTVIAARVSSDAWSDSQILIIGGGSLLTNYAMLNAASRDLAGKLLVATQLDGMSEKRKVGFLYSNDNGVPISSLDPENNSLSGLDIFLVWPMNLILIHGFLLGLAICLRLWPILGRPKQLAELGSTDFADHIRAVAALMSKTRGEQYARVRISEYMVRVRGEQSGPWVLPAGTQPVLRPPESSEKA